MRLVFDGSLTVSRVNDFRVALLSSFDASSDIIVDISDADDVDLSFLQLLVSAQKEAAARNIDVKIFSQDASMLTAAMERCGISSQAQSGIRVVPEIVGELTS